ncbi:DUF835 domain-containing protein [Pyrococcus horikoshii]|uniref:DUF835 domain-containing protein n=2 Tax=Pyrococcus horikoshii TaxID=53953 RepID=O58250_PYRHO|nr:DUF835 domain-containing protein [Pyrococcus horikoshii]BAA29602.1 352aa long hypothetical protein [Pyrococcus horikoshii OT3]HII60914.1 DUF835 domain-containing protein [Pyrococcus horikoshii]
MSPLSLGFAMIITIGIKLTGSAFLGRVYYRTRRKSSVVLSLALALYALNTLSDLLKNYFLNQLFLALSSACFFMALYYLEAEEEKAVPSKTLYLTLSLTPLLITIYVWLLERVIPTSETWSIVGVSWGISGFFILASGVSILKLRDIFGNRILWLSASLIAIGAHEMDYPFLRPIKWFAPIGFLLAATFVVLLVYGIFLVFGSEVYFKRKSPGKISIKLKPGSMIMNMEEFKAISPSLQNFPVLAFVRHLKTPETWYSYFVTRARSDGGAVDPMNLPRIIELSRKYFQSVERGVVVIDCLEYLVLYNGFENTAKHLAILRDYATVNNGTLILITSKEAWGEKEWSLLVRMFS